jgi:hypothetical protein
VTQSKWIQDVGLAMNFEARGTCGPSLMFETSRPDGALVREFARAAPYPRAASFFRDLYERMPVGTDFSLFKMRGVAGLNFAYIGNARFYHTSEDNLGRMDDRSVQHQGSSALALVRHFGGMPLPLSPAPDAAFFNFGNFLVHYPVRWIPVIEGCLAILFLMTCWRLRRRGGFNFKSALLGLGFVLGVGVGATLFGQGYLKLFKVLQPHWADLAFGQVYGRGWLTAALVAPLGIIVFRLTVFAAQRLGRAELSAAITATGIVVSGALCWKSPGASHLGFALLMSGLLLLGLSWWLPNARIEWLAALAALVPVLAIWIPLMRYLQTPVWASASGPSTLLSAISAMLGNSGRDLAESFVLAHVGRCRCDDGDSPRLRIKRRPIHRTAATAGQCFLRTGCEYQCGILGDAAGPARSLVGRHSRPVGQTRDVPVDFKLARRRRLFLESARASVADPVAPTRTAPGRMHQ